jgi:hypothetical protein
VVSERTSASNENKGGMSETMFFMLTDTNLFVLTETILFTLEDEKAFF